MADSMQGVIHEMRSNVGMASQFVEDVPDDAMTRQFGAVKNHPAWQLGHIAVSLGYLAQVIGADYSQPEGWDALFPPGTHPTDEPGRYPGKAALLEELTRASEAVASKLATLEPGALAEPFPEEKFRKLWPTLDAGVHFFAVSHVAFHAGQLSAWRRLMNLPSALPA